MDSEKIIITTEDLKKADKDSTTACSERSTVPLWWRILSSLLVFCPPLLFIVIIAGLLRFRRKDLFLRYSYILHYCFLLLISGILWAIIISVSVFLLFSNHNPWNQSKDKSALFFQENPSLPSETSLSGRDIAQQMSNLVVIVHLAQNQLYPFPILHRKAFGAGVIVFADHEECLIVTSRHIIEAITRTSSLEKHVAITTKDQQQVQAVVVGLHRDLDIALLLALRDYSTSLFLQPVREFNTIEIGEQIFVIGHPEGLDFSLSAGLISQIHRDKNLIQISAPISPGSSGGPVYDTHGRLLGIVQSTFDKKKRPHAENLNFAVSVDDLLNADAWILTERGRNAVSSFDILHRKKSKVK